MHALLSSIGTDGDVFPYLGLGVRLRARGHQVTLAANEHYHSLAHDYGLDFLPLVSTAETEEALAHPDMWHPLKSAYLIAQWGVRFLERQYAALLERARSTDVVLVASPAVLAARVIQERLRRPLASIVLQPWMIPSLSAPPIMPAGLTLPRWAPRVVGQLYFRLLDAIGHALMGRQLARIRRGLKPVGRVFQWWLSPDLVIGMFPAWYGPPQADWPSQIRLTGFPMHDGRPESSMPADLLEYCQAGSAPIAFTFGTGMMHAGMLFREAVEACRLLGRRGLFLTRHEAQLLHPLPPFIRHCPFAPFRQLFPNCAAVVHHGGIGTTAKALGAGAPQLILHLAYDQLDNATRVKRLGAGDFLSGRRRTAAQIAEALAHLLTPQVKTRCQAVAAQFGQEDSLERACELIEGMGR